MQVDSHQHFWTLARNDYGWLTPGAGPIYRDFQPAHLRPMLRATGVHCSIAVQAAPTVEETRYLLNIAHLEDVVAGVVGWVDMDCPGRALADLEVLARDEAFLGIRPMIQDIDNPDWMLGSAPAAVFERLADLNLRFDALVRPVHLPRLSELLGRYPEMSAVVDHGAKPAIADRSWQPWADHMAALAEDTGAFCKLSGLLSEARATDTEEDLLPYMDHLFRCFGPERLMWGSDWPVLMLGGRAAEAAPSFRPERRPASGAKAREPQQPGRSYRGWHAMVKRWLKNQDAVAKRAIEGGAAIRFYGLCGEAGND